MTAVLKRRRGKGRRDDETIGIPVELFFDLLEHLDSWLHSNDESPRFHPRGTGEIIGGVGGGEGLLSLTQVLLLEGRLREILGQREIDRAVAKELAARGVKSAELVGLAGGKGRR